MMATSAFFPRMHIAAAGEDEYYGSSSSSSGSSCSSCVESSPPPPTSDNAAHHILMLEGDVLTVSHDGIARTCYHLTTTSTSANPSSPTTNSTTADALKKSPALVIEEQFDLQRARKTFLVREMDESCGSTNDTNMGDQEDMVVQKQTTGLHVAPMGRLLGSVEIQELVQGECPLSECSSTSGTSGDQTGRTTWEASIAMALCFMAHEPSLLSGRIIELGCGVGLGGILTQMGPLLQQRTTTKSSTPTRGSGITSITLTDGNEQVLKECRHNVQSAIAAMSGDTKIPPVFVKNLDWNCIAETDQHLYNVVIACDVAYLYTDVEPLGNALEKLLVQKKNGNGQIHLFGPYNRGALQRLHVYLKEVLDLYVVWEWVDMDRYRLEPLNIRSNNDIAFSSSVSSSPGQQWCRENPEILNAHVADDRAYASKSTAKFVHITATHKDANSNNDQNVHKSSLEDID